MIPSTGSLQPRLSSSTVSMSQMLFVSIPKQLSTGHLLFSILGRKIFLIFLLCVAGRGRHAPYLEGAGMGLQAHIWRLKQGTKCSWLKKKGWAANAVRVDDENCLGSKI